MFKIMPNVYEAELHRAEAEAKAVEMEYKNTKSLVEQNIVSPNELAVIEAQLQKAPAEVELAKTHLAFTDVKAPFTGKMDRLEARTGSLLDEGELLTTLSDISTMWVYFNVPESEYLKYAQNNPSNKQTPVRLKLADGSYEHQGVIDAIEADFDNHTGTIEMRASFLTQTSCYMKQDRKCHGGYCLSKCAGYSSEGHIRNSRSKLCVCAG